MAFILYSITNQVDRKIYFGITKCPLQKRWNEHKHSLKNGSSHLHRAMRKYGVKNFIMRNEREFDEESKMYKAEIDMIALHKSNNPKYGYNNSIGGEHSSKGKKLSKETKRKISQYQLGRKRRPHSKEAKENMRKAALGRDMSKAVKESADKSRGKPSHNRKPVILNRKVKYDSIKLAAESNNILMTSIINNIKGLSKKTKVGIWNYL